MLKQTASYRVYYEDTDAGGVVYHANYLKFAERARTDWLRAFGYEQSKLADSEKALIVVHKLEIAFHSPAKLDDLLYIETELIELKNVSMKMRQEITCEGLKLASIEVSLACVGAEKKPMRWPLDVHQNLSSLLRL